MRSRSKSRARTELRVAHHAVRACSTGRIEGDVSTRPPDVNPTKGKVKYLAIYNVNVNIPTSFIMVHYKVLPHVLQSTMTLFL